MPDEHTPFTASTWPPPIWSDGKVRVVSWPFSDPLGPDGDTVMAVTPEEAWRPYSAFLRPAIQDPDVLAIWYVPEQHDGAPLEVSLDFFMALCSTQQERRAPGTRMGDVDLQNLPPRADSLIATDEGMTVIPEARLVTIYGAAGTGKSWIALDAARAAAGRGRRALYVDGETNLVSIARRFRMLPGHEHAEDLRHVRYSEYAGRSEELIGFIAGSDGPGCVVLDSARRTGAGTTHESIDAWLMELVQPFRSIGATVIIVDHMPLRSDPLRSAGGIYSQAKIGDVDVALRTAGGPLWKDGIDGSVNLILDKDRESDMSVLEREAVAWVVGSWRGEDEHRAFDLAYRSPGGVPAAAAPDQALLDATLAALVAAGRDGLNKTQARNAVRGRHERVASALEALVHMQQAYLWDGSYVAAEIVEQEQQEDLF